MFYVFIILLLHVALTIASPVVVFGPEFPMASGPRLALQKHLSSLPVTPRPLTVHFGGGIGCSEMPKNISVLFRIQSVVIENGNQTFCSIGRTPRANLFAAFAVLERFLGFAFFHPLRVTVPTSPGQVSSNNQTIDVMSSALSVRGYHYHTEHPLELTEFFNGLDGADGSSWSSMMKEFESVLQWLIARRQNTLEFLVLWAAEWDTFAWSSTRQTRLQQINGLAKQYLIDVAADVPVAERQQHAWYMVQGPKTATADIRRHVDWLAKAGFQAISTENGYSEFTHGNCSIMLDWLNQLTEYAWSAHQMEVRIKMHCSTGQTCAGLKDPFTGRPINFNFLPTLANKNLQVMPHTVQLYRLDDPAPTYDNFNFTYMAQETLLTVNSGRKTIFHPETAYWVNFDINVPLFLPTYADSRVADLKLLSDLGAAQKLHGHIIFTSGWEWGYWLNDLITAEAVADYPVLTTFTQILERIAPRLLPSLASQQSFVDTVQKVVSVQRSLFIWNNSTTTHWTLDSQLVDINGIGYLTGWDTFSDISKIGSELGFAFAKHALTNPSKIMFFEIDEQRKKFEKFVEPMLQSIISQLQPLNQTMYELAEQSSAPDLMFDLADSLQMTLLRAEQVYSLYLAALGGTGRESNLSKAANAMVQAQMVVTGRQLQYRVPLERVAFWEHDPEHPKNPTAYQYGYLWTVKSLHYFWRDYAIVSGRRLIDYSPCLFNIKNPADVAVGEGVEMNATDLLAAVLGRIGLKEISDCLNPPSTEPKYSFMNDSFH